MNLWFETNIAKVLWSGLDDQDEWVVNRTRDECNKKNMINENADKNGQNIGNDDDYQGEATESDYLVNVSQNNVTLSFEDVEEMSEGEKIKIKNILQIGENNLDEKVNQFKKVDRIYSNTGQYKLNAILKKIKFNKITKTNRLIRVCAIFVEKSRPQTNP